MEEIPMSEFVEMPCWRLDNFAFVSYADIATAYDDEGSALINYLKCEEHQIAVAWRQQR